MSAALSGVATLDSILAVAKRVPIFPCLRHDEVAQINGKEKIFKAKSPHVEGGFHAATQDPQQIIDWWNRWPDALVGVPMGAPTGFVAIDYDIAKKTTATDDWISTHSTSLTRTRTHGTMRGGRHWIFKIPEGRRYRTGTCIKLGGIERPGLDLRGEGGYVIWWPLHGGAVGDVREPIEVPAGLLDDRLILMGERFSEPLPSSSPERWRTQRPSVADALAWLDPAHRDNWVEMGMALHHASNGSDDGFSLWHAWSSGDLTGELPSGYVDIEDCRYTWTSFGRYAGKPKTLGSLFFQAKAAREAAEAANPRQQIEPENLPAREGEEAPSDDLIKATAGLIPGTDMAYGRRLYERHGKNLHYTVERGWLVWSGQRWQVDDKAVGVAALAMESAESLFDEIRESHDRQTAFKLSKIACQKRTIESAIWLTRPLPDIYQQLITFDAEPMILNCRNGIVDLTTGNLRDHDRKARCTMVAGTDFDPNAKAPRWRQFIGEVCLKNEELMDYLQRACGYLLTASVREHCLFFMHGAGRNGKSVLVEAIMKAMGEYAGAAEPEMLMTRKHQSIPVDVAALRGRRAVFLNETNQGQRFDEAKLKNLTGGDRLQARFMRENLFEFDPTHKLVLRGNHKPTVNGTDEGIWSRLRLIPFDLRLEPHELDRRLAETLHGELPGILAWMVEGCLQWQREGLHTPSVITDAVSEYRSESDVIGRFIEECCDVNVNRRVKAGTLYQRYKEFCEIGGERWLSSKDFPTELEHRGYKRTKSNGQKFVEGLGLATTAMTTYGNREEF